MELALKSMLDSTAMDEERLEQLREYFSQSDLRAIAEIGGVLECTYVKQY